MSFSKLDYSCDRSSNIVPMRWHFNRRLIRQFMFSSFYTKQKPKMPIKFCYLFHVFGDSFPSIHIHSCCVQIKVAGTSQLSVLFCFVLLFHFLSCSFLFRCFVWFSFWKCYLYAASESPLVRCQTNMLMRVKEVNIR